MRRWPVIRHIRYFLLLGQVRQHYAMWRKLGCLPVHADHDYAVLDRVWRGEL